MRDLDVRVLDALKGELLGDRNEIILLLGLICHHGWQDGPF